MSNANSDYVHWSSRWTFIMAATGSAVGLGNIWKFPYITGEYGGGAFVIVYLACIAIVGIPVMVGEVLLGRAGRTDPIHSMLKLSRQSDSTAWWAITGVSGVLAGLIILSFYSVVAGWAIEYVWKAGTGAFMGADAATVGSQFTEFLTNTEQLTISHTIFIILTGLVVMMGVTKGLGNAVRILMPLLFILLLVLLGYSLAEGNFQAGAGFMFSTDFSKLSGEAVLTALGHAFFTLSLGMGAIMAYGSYMPEEASIGKTVIAVAFLDTLIALVAGLAIFPLVFANSLEPNSGPGLMFVTLPIAFGNMTGGLIFGTMFFALVVIAAWSSSISLVEPAVAWLEKLGVKRWIATVVLCLIGWAGGIACIFSNNWLEDKQGFYTFEWLDYIASNIMLPLGGLMIAIFVGWIMKRKFARRQMADIGEPWFNIWYGCIRVFAPLGVIVVFLHSLGFI